MQFQQIHFAIQRMYIYQFQQIDFGEMTRRHHLAEFHKRDRFIFKRLKGLLENKEFGNKDFFRYQFWRVLFVAFLSSKFTLRQNY